MRGEPGETGFCAQPKAVVYPLKARACFAVPMPACRDRQGPFGHGLSRISAVIQRLRTCVRRTSAALAVLANHRCPGYIACHQNPPCDQDIDVTTELPPVGTYELDYNVTPQNGSWPTSVVLYWYE